MMQAEENTEIAEQWHVMKARNRSIFSVRELLEKLAVTSFIPMKSVIRMDRSGKKKNVDIPLLSNLLFVKATKNQIFELNRTYDCLQVLYDRTTGNPYFGKTMTVANTVMEEFIQFVDGATQYIEEVDVANLKLESGQKVRITSGPFEGKIATFVSMKGKRKKQIVAMIDGFVAVMATASFTAEKI